MARTVGVEEELLLVDARSGEPRAVADAVLDGGPWSRELVAELQQQQLELNSSPCVTLDQLGEELRAWRRRAAGLARSEGVAVAALGTSPVAVPPRLTPRGRYRRMAQAFGLTAQETLTCGCHVHVGVESDEEGVAVVDRIRPWLPPLLALSSNSPLWQGADTGYASYRYQVFGRWPTAGPTRGFGSAEGYRAAVSRLLATGILIDQGMLYFDARLSAKFPTVEVRVCDVCSEYQDAVVLAALVRGLVETAAREWADGRPAPGDDLALLRLASWRASRSGLDGALLDPRTFRPAGAHKVVETLVGHIEDALKDAGDLYIVRAGIDRLTSVGSGARRQREVYARGGGTAVLRDAVRRTAA
ncbi:carboxylate-amine ligase [Actinacidiphila glaucinigra]|uniref:carboxylate-amine ligase n=1 Tax=Actinacidiphila glaucinigra TaxID=235986 RepID=UPI003D930808